MRCSYWELYHTPDWFVETWVDMANEEDRERNQD